MQLFFYAVICLLHVILSLQAGEYITTKEGDPIVYETLFIIDNKKCTLKHSYPQTLKTEYSLDKQTMGYANSFKSNDAYKDTGNSGRHDFNNSQTKINIFIKQFLPNISKINTLILQSITMNSKQNLTNLTFNRDILKTIIKAHKNKSCINVDSIECTDPENFFDKEYIDNRIIGTKFSYFLPIKITDDPLFAQYKLTTSELVVPNIQLYNTHNHETTISLPANVIIKQFFLDYVNLYDHKNPFSLLLVGSIPKYFQNKSMQKAYTISVYDCSEFANNNTKSFTPLILQMTLNVSTIFMSSETDTTSLISVKNGTCILHDFKLKKNIIINFRRFLSEQSFNSAIDLAGYGLDDTILQVEKINDFDSAVQVSPNDVNSDLTSDTEEDETFEQKSRDLLHYHGRFIISDENNHPTLTSESNTPNFETQINETLLLTHTYPQKISSIKPINEDDLLNILNIQHYDLKNTENKTEKYIFTLHNATFFPDQKIFATCTSNSINSIDVYCTEFNILITQVPLDKNLTMHSFFLDYYSDRDTRLNEAQKRLLIVYNTKKTGTFCIAQITLDTPARPIRRLIKADNIIAIKNGLIQYSLDSKILETDILSLVYYEEKKDLDTTEEYGLNGKPTFNNQPKVNNWYTFTYTTLFRTSIIAALLFALYYKLS